MTAGEMHTYSTAPIYIHIKTLMENEFKHLQKINYSYEFFGIPESN
jgi:hypothetical protein